MEKIKLSKDLKISRLVHGQWRMADWKMNGKEILNLTEQVIELGIISFRNSFFKDRALPKSSSQA